MQVIGQQQYDFRQEEVGQRGGELFHGMLGWKKKNLAFNGND